MDRIKLIHSKDHFLLEINDTPLQSVSAYTVESTAGGATELTLKTSIDMDVSSIDIENKDVKLR